MNASMQQKVALTAAHLLAQGWIADMGMGSGKGSHSLAALYPGLRVTGVDVNPEIVTIASDAFELRNLDFRIGDIAQQVFDEASLDGILNSSVLHHVTTFSGYDRAAAGRALACQVPQLKPHGVLIVRDFVDPGPGRVTLELRTDDGDDSEDPASCSTANLLRRFAREFRSLSDTPGFELREQPATTTGWEQFELSLTHAVEFILRKDYRRDWETEVKEEYTYFTQEEFEAAFAGLGLRVLASTPIRNPWIVRNRYRGKFVLRNLEGRELEDPATNYVIVGERVPDGTGVRFAADDTAPLHYLTLDHYRDRETGTVMDLVSRPNLTIDAIPWFSFEDDLFVLARMSYPRPILGAKETPSIDGNRPPAYITEPLTVIQEDKPVAQTIEDALRHRIGIGGEALRAFDYGTTYLPSPGGLREEMRSMFVEIDPVFVQRDIPDHSGFSSSGRVGAIEARQLLRAAQVGGLPDARLELNVYDLLRRHGVDAGPWIGESITLEDREDPGRTPFADLQSRRRRRFERVGQQESSGFLELRCRTFRELDREGRVLQARALEFVSPAPLSAHTVSVAVLRRAGPILYIGIDDADLPAAQCIGGNSNVLVAPAWRLPHAVDSLTPACAWVRERLRQEYGVEVGEHWWLGGRYHPSPGATVEVVHPLAVDATAIGPGARSLLWVPLHELLQHPRLLRDGHLRIAAERAAHALS